MIFSSSENNFSNDEYRDLRKYEENDSNTAADRRDVLNDLKIEGQIEEILMKVSEIT